jgi:hypothetical protein
VVILVLPLDLEPKLTVLLHSKLLLINVDQK